MDRKSCRYVQRSCLGAALAAQSSMGFSLPPAAASRRCFLPAGLASSPAAPAAAALRRGPAMRSPDASHGSSSPRFSCSREVSVSTVGSSACTAARGKSHQLAALRIAQKQRMRGGLRNVVNAVPDQPSLGRLAGDFAPRARRRGRVGRLSHGLVHGFHAVGDTSCHGSPCITSEPIGAATRRKQRRRDEHCTCKAGARTDDALLGALELGIKYLDANRLELLLQRSLR